MSKITFVYMRKKYQKNIDTNSLLSDEIKKFSSTLNLSLDNLYCIYLGKSLNINTGKKISNYTKKNILIYIFNLKKINVKKDEQLNNLLCPFCEELISMAINDEKTTLKNCCNNHKLQNLSISLFIKLQNKIKEKDKSCFNCNNNLIYYNHYYICSCNNFICPLCRDEHNEKIKNLIKL